MGQIKNIKLHIVTDIKKETLSSTLTCLSHHVQPFKDCFTCAEECCSCHLQTTSNCKTCRSSNLNSFSSSFFIAHISSQSRYRSCCQIHWSWSGYSRCCRFWRWYWNCLWKSDHRLCKKSITKTTAVLLCHPWIYTVRSHGTFLAYDGVLNSVWFVDCALSSLGFLP